MKRIKSILTVLMAAVFAFSLVPTGAFAAPNDESIANHNSTGSTGVLGGTGGTGSITIDNSKQGETYKVYRLFELASFDDEDTATGIHGTEDKDEAYSYAIAQTVVTDSAANPVTTGTNPWYTFLTTQGPVGSSYKYAVLSDETDANKLANAYFVIDKEAVTIDGNSTYHHIRANPSYNGNFKNGSDDTGDTTSRIDAPGNPVGIDYVTNDNSAVQDFAQEALKYANANANAIAPLATVVGTGDADLTLLDPAPLGYYLVGTSMGTLASLDTNNPDVKIREKNDEPTIEKNVLKKGAAFGSDAAFLAGRSLEYKTAKINEAQAKIDAADAILATAEVNSEEYTQAQTDKAAAEADLETANGIVVVWVDDTDADLYDYVQFRTVVTAQQGMKDYRIHDVMEPGLTLVTDQSADLEEDRYTDYDGDYTPKVYLVRDTTVYEVPQQQGGKTNWELKTGNGTQCWVSAETSSSSCDFEVWLYDADPSDDKVTFNLASTDVDVKDGDKIVVTYWCQLNEDACVWEEEDGPGVQSRWKENDGSNHLDGPVYDCNSNGRNDNYTMLTYGNKSYTNWDKASVTTYELDIAKTNGYDQDGKGSMALLKDAKFSLYKATTMPPQQSIGPPPMHATVGHTTYYQVGPRLKFDTGDDVLLATANDNETDCYDAVYHGYRYVGDAASEADGNGTQIVTTADKKVKVWGLEAGDYILVEDEAPAGYNRLAHPIVVTVKGDVDSDCLISGDPGYDDAADQGGTPLNAETYDADEGYLTYSFVGNNGVTSTSKVVGGARMVAGAEGVLYNERSNPNAQPHHKPIPNGGVHVINQTGQELPSTGGIGTTIFYVAGTVLVVGAAVMLVAKRRMGAEA